MSFSLLYKSRTETEQSGVLYDLSVDRIVDVFCADQRRADYFMDVLSRPLQTTEGVVYRQQILGDLRSCAGLFADLQLVFTRYDKIKSDWRELRLSASSTGVSVNPEAQLERTFASLKVTAMFPSTIVSFYSSLLDTLGKYNLSSEGLLSMRSYCGEMLHNDSLSEVVRIAELFQYRTLEDYTFGVTVGYDATLRLASSELCEIALRGSKPNALAKLFTRKKDDDGSTVVAVDADEETFRLSGKTPAKASTAPDNRSDVVDLTGEDASFALGESLTRIDAALTKITDSIYENFFGLSRELMFYEAALQFCRFADERGLPLCMPELLPAELDTIELEGVRDLILAAEGKPADKIIPNSILLDSTREGIIVRGKNNTGKTVFLRSVGITQLLAQSGLPVCADRARISLRGGVFSHFSSAEEEFMAGDAAGRFDGEVKAVAHIINSLRPYSLILLNETFQTTAYDEGTDGIAGILDILPRTGAKYIFVTHLLGLFRRCDPNRVKLLTSDEGFRINDMRS
jgi:Mismatch repair ATPase (MutS family)